MDFVKYNCKMQFKCTVIFGLDEFHCQNFDVLFGHQPRAMYMQITLLSRL